VVAPHRPLAAALVAVGVASAVLVGLLPTDAITRGRWREPFFLAWSLLEVGLILALLVLEGEGTSPVAALLFVPMVFAAVSYPLLSVVAVGTVAVAGYVAVGLAVGAARPELVLLFAVSLALTAWISAWHARSHGEQRERLADLSRTDPLRAA
jgi:hypothetical protein